MSDLNEMLTVQIAVFDAGELTRVHWESRRSDMKSWLRNRGFTPSGADRAVHNFIETMVFVAAETGEPQIGKKNA